MTDIADFQEHQEYPNVNGIIFPDGRICFVNVSSVVDSDLPFTVNPAGETTVDELERQSELNWNDGAILAESVSNDGSLKAVCGEGDYGSDGFIALICLETQKTLWIASSTVSNPFEAVEFKKGRVCAKSTLGRSWHFPINDPCHFTVTKDTI